MRELGASIFYHSGYILSLSACEPFAAVHVVYGCSKGHEHPEIVMVLRGKKVESGKRLGGVYI